MKLIAFICGLTLVWFGFYIADVANADYFNKIEYKPILIERIDTIKVPEFISRKPIEGKIKRQLVGRIDILNSLSVHPETTMGNMPNNNVFSVDFITDSIKVYTTISVINDSLDSARLDSIWVQPPPIARRDSFMISIPNPEKETTVTDYLVYALSVLGIFKIIEWVQ